MAATLSILYSWARQVFGSAIEFDLVDASLAVFFFDELETVVHPPYLELAVIARAFMSYYLLDLDVSLEIFEGVNLFVA